MAIRSATLNVMTRAAMKAARGLKRDFGEVENLQVSKKGPADFVSTADLKAEKVLREELSHARPDYGFLMEESDPVESRDPEGRRWVVDPLDGTTNFLHGLPHFAISIGLEARGEMLAAVVYDPVKDEMFVAEKGAGTFLNDRRLRVSSRNRMSESIFATGIPFMGRGDQGQFLHELGQVMAQSAGVRRWGAAALDLAYVAAGRVDGFWERGLQPWDMAAGWLLVREAGGLVSEIGGRSLHLGSASLLAANESLHGELDKLLKRRPAA
jgi:myo-inositol-1(or 4)-monophosphatase